MTQVLSVDLGTTYSAAAVADGSRIEICTLGTRSPSIPSVVALRPDGAVLIGDAAERRAVSEPTRVAREFKRRLGDPVPVVIGGTPYGAEALMAHLLRWIVDRVTDQEGAVPQRVVLTHPANYGPYKLDLVRQVGHLAEVEPVELLTEPEAAAVHYAARERVAPGDVVAVYDLGGGTFDAALVRLGAAGFELIGTPDGIDRFGGIDLDEAVFTHVRETLGRAMDSLDPDDPAVTTALARLRDDCRQAKESLSSDTEAVVPVMLPNLHTEVRLTRAELEDMIRPRLRETLTTLDRVVHSADLRWSDVARVLLVGGSSRIPLVGEMVRAHTGRPATVDAHPKHAIALGAAAAAVAGATVAPAAQPSPRAEPEHGAAPPLPDTDADTGVDGGTNAEPERPAEPMPVATAAAPHSAHRRSMRVIGGFVVAALAALTAVLVFVLLRGEDGTGDSVADTRPSSSSATIPADAGQDEGASSAGTEPEPEMPEGAAPEPEGPGATEPEAAEPGAIGPAPVELPPIDDAPPSERVLALYRLDYRSVDVSGGWEGWSDATEAAPPTDIASDYWPALGPYDSNSPEIVGQHLGWLRRAGVGGIVVRWDGPDAGRTVSLLLELGQQYEVRLAFVVSTEAGGPDEVVARAEQALAEFSGHPQYLRLTDVDRDARESARPLLVLDPPPEVANPEDWAGVIGAIRGLGDGVAVVVASIDPRWVELTPADGLLGGPSDDDGYSWSAGIPDNVWYLPTIRPGLSGQRIGEPATEDRAEGARFQAAWRDAVSPRSPTFVVIDSFNDWARGTQIEPAAPDVPERATVPYRTYAPLEPETYLDLTRDLVDATAR